MQIGHKIFNQKLFNYVMFILSLACVINSILYYIDTRSMKDSDSKIHKTNPMPGNNPGSGYSGPPPIDER